MMIIVIIIILPTMLASFYQFPALCQVFLCAFDLRSRYHPRIPDQEKYASERC